MFIGILLSRLLFIACMVFILGYIFGNFSASKTLTRITKVAAGNVFIFRGRNWRYTDKEHTECYREKSDSKHSY